MSREPGRLVEIDALRGLAAMAVVLFHLTQRFTELYAPAQLPSVLVKHGHYGVNLFFIISGFVIFMTLDRTQRPMDFVVSRFSRLFPAYWCAIALTFVITHALALPLKTVTLQQALANVFMLHGLFNVPHVDGVYWTLEVELLFYMHMFILYRSGLLHRLAYYVCALLALRVLYTVLERYAGIELSWTVSHLLILTFLPWFGLGIAIYRLVHPSPAFGRKQGLGVAAAALATLFYVDGAGLGLLAVVLFAAVWAAAAGRLRWLRWPVLVWLGAISYPLYLLHENIGWAIQLQLISRGWSTDAAVLAALAAALLLATALHHWVEQPALRAIRQRYRPRPAMA